MTKTRKILYGSMLALIAVLFVLGSFFDKTIADLFFQPENIMARLMESVGIFTPFIFISATFAVLFFLVKGEDKYRTLKKTLLAVAAVIPYLIYGYMASETYLSVLWARALVAIGAAIVLTPLTFLFFRNKGEVELRKYSIFLIFASIVCVLSSLLLVNVLKYIWGRVRYREMIADADYLLTDFTPWYHINGFSLHGHHSFPSGHTCSATNLLVLCAADEVFEVRSGQKKTVIFIVALYIFAMAYSRLVLGAHFLSDVTGGFFIGFLTYAVARYVYFDKTRLVVDAIMRTNALESEEGAEALPLEESEREESESATEGQGEEPLPEVIVESAHKSGEEEK